MRLGSTVLKLAVAGMVLGVAWPAFFVGGIPSPGAPALAHVTEAALGGTPPSAALHPLVLPAANTTTVSVKVTSSLPSYTLLPLGPVAVTFSISVTHGTITPANVTLWANVTDVVSQTVCTKVDLDSLVTPVNGSGASYSFDLTTANVGNLTHDSIACPGIANDSVDIVVGATVDGTGAPTNGTVATSDSNATSTTPGTYLIFAVPENQLVFAPASASYTYNLSSDYSGQYVGRVSLTIYSSSEVNGNRSVVFSAALLWLHGVRTVAAWYEPHGGTYPYTLQEFTPYDNVTTQGVVEVANVTPVYYNSTTYHNQSFLGSLGPAGGGALLLVAGFVAGAVIALLVGRSLGRSGPATPPSAWKSDQTPASSNTCSLCGKSFGTPEELAAHGKSEHGLD